MARLAVLGKSRCWWEGRLRYGWKGSLIPGGEGSALSGKELGIRPTGSGKP